MAQYVDLGYVDAGYVESTVIVPPVEGVFDFDVGTPGAAKHRKAFASTRALELAYWQAGSPWSPYDVQPVFVLVTRLGMYGFSTLGCPTAVEDFFLDFETTLEPPEPLSFRSVPLASNIIGSVTAVERTTSRVVIRDPTGKWAQKLWIEAIVNMPAGRFWMVKQIYSVPALVGTVGRISYKNRSLTIEYGDFRRQFSSEQ